MDSSEDMEAPMHCISLYRCTECEDGSDLFGRACVCARAVMQGGLSDGLCCSAAKP